jgi:purine-binding chemotaxis protein CheW
VLDLLKIRKKTGHHKALSSGAESAAPAATKPPAKAPESAPQPPPAEAKREAKEPAAKSRKPAKAAAVAMKPDPAPQPVAAKTPPPALVADKSPPLPSPEPPPPARSEMRQARPAAAAVPAPAADSDAPPATAAAPLHPPELPASDDALNRHLLCKVHQETFAVPISDILEILRERSLTPLPLTAPALAGILSLRGRMVPVVDAALRLGFEPFPSDENCRIVVFELAGEWIGLRVAAVGQVSVIDPDAVQHSAAALGEARADITSGVLRISDQFVTVPVLQQLLDVTGA